MYIYVCVHVYTAYDIISRYTTQVQQTKEQNVTMRVRPSRNQRKGTHGYVAGS